MRRPVTRRYLSGRRMKAFRRARRVGSPPSSRHYRGTTQRALYSDKDVECQDKMEE